MFFTRSKFSILFKMILFTIIYILIFSGYYVTTGFINVMYPNIGFWSFVIFYLFYGLSNFVAPFLILKFSFRLIFSISAFTFLIMIGFTASYIVPLLLIGSGICGFGNGFIWLIQGIYLSSLRLEDEKINNNAMGIFFSFFNINMIFGNGIALIILLTGVSLQIMIFSMLGVTGLGVFLSLFLSINKEKETATETKTKTNLNNSFFKEIQKTILMYRKCYLTILCMIYSSIGLNITYQIIPRLLVFNTIGTLEIKAIYNAATYITYGISAMMFSMLWGKLLQRNEKIVLYSYTILEIFCLIGMLMLGKYSTIQGYWIIIGFVRGSIDYGVNNLINVSLSKNNKEDINYLFALYRLIYSISYLITAIIVGYLPYEYVLLICGIFSTISTISYSFNKEIHNNIETQFENSKVVV